MLMQILLQIRMQKRLRMQVHGRYVGRTSIADY